MAGVTGVRPEFIQVTGYELASEAILSAIVPFLVVRMQSSTQVDPVSALPRPDPTSISGTPSGSRA